ncbi:2-C-methyl-D-erythritol 4-phosphate cytidylyltransferase [Thermosulfuriphilus sp.]
MIAAIIPAGGIGSRLGAPIPKQFLEVAGKPLILYCLEVFEACPMVDTVIIAVVKEYLDKTEALIQQAGLKKIFAVVPGGASRQESVLSGLKTLPEGTEIVLVHDAARPLVTVDLIIRVLKKARETGAAIAACPVRDTVKEVEDQLIKRTLDRERLFLAQTPQAARIDLLKEAFSWAQTRGLVATDEAGLLEALGIPVAIVCSSLSNLKVTTTEDLLIAEALLEKRGLFS